jgi:hypothetical protein
MVGQIGHKRAMIAQNSPGRDRFGVAARYVVLAAVLTIYGGQV